MTREGQLNVLASALGSPASAAIAYDLKASSVVWTPPGTPPPISGYGRAPRDGVPMAKHCGLSSAVDQQLPIYESLLAGSSKGAGES